MSMTRREMELKLEAQRRGLSAPPEKESSYFTETVKNIPSDVVNVGKSMAHAAMNPAQTINMLGEAFFGGAENLAEAAGLETSEELSDVGRYSQAANLKEKANALGGMYKEQYGSWDKIKESFKERPVTTLLDASLVTGGVGGAVSTIPKAGGVGQSVRSVAAAIDPVNMTISAAKAPIKAAEAVIPKSAKAATIDAIMNLMPRHRARSGKALTELGGPEAPEIIKNLEYQAQIIPGNQPTAIQAAMGGGRLGPGSMGPPSPPINRPQFAALDAPMQKRKPATHEARMEEQRIGRANALQEGIARSPSEKRAAIKARKDTTDPMYDAARNSTAPVDVMPVIQKIDAIISGNPGNSRLLKEMNKLKEGLYDGKIPRTKAKEIISSIEGLKTTLANQKNTFIKKELQGIKKDLIDSVPMYKAADMKFKEMSRPINQMEIGEYLVEKIRPIKGDTEGITKFINATENARLTIKNSLGEPRYMTLQEALDPQQQQILWQVRNEINRDAIIAAKGRKGRARMAETMEAALDPIELPGMLSTKMMVMRNVMSRLKGHATGKTTEYMADRQFNPSEWAAIMKEATEKEKSILGSREAFNKRMMVNQALFQSGRAGEENQ